MGVEPLWLVVFSRGGEPAYKVLLGYDGSHIDWAPADKEFSNVQRLDDEVLIEFRKEYTNLEKGTGFYEMSVQEKAAFSEKWIPIVEAYMETHPYFIKEGNSFYEATRHVYGVPGSEDISQEQATEIAHQSVIALGGSAETIDNRPINYYFDITSPDSPVWKLTFLPAYSENMDQNDGNRYRVVINGRTGEVLEAFAVTKDHKRDEYMY